MSALTPPLASLQRPLCFIAEFRKIVMSNRFAILLHDDPWWHWDFLLEHGDHALCWRLLRQPCVGEPIAAEALAPHRLLYLNYEGPVGNNRGAVKRVGSGTYEIVASQVVKPHADFSITLFGLDWAQRAGLAVVGQNRLFWNFS